ncbi:Hypothetical predicted protein [Olea europaea subsp. europaea]|uniref:Uncharacterized protein n=1 Tax=Olea europaea subsp. europaea TaxID=158383 RepID=A0A8S0SHP8_OLEEU|nr:Hypothetical predicted protein [Olea europaea subsp. europaea]
MKGRDGKGPPSADLLVCFPSRAHLTLMPKPICSPARPNSEPNKRHQHQYQHQHQHHHNRRPRLHQHLRKSSNRGGGAGYASPLMWAKNKATSSEIEEPTSPKVTCAGQIKVRSKPNTCKNWQSVMEEIEKLHNSKKHKKRPAWIEALGFKKDIMQFLTCLRSIRFDFHCFGSFPSADITSDDDEEDEDDKQQAHDEDNETSRTVFSKWFMVLQENQSKQFTEKESKEKYYKSSTDDDVPCAPPPNALLLMRCRSAPAKSWLEDIEAEKKENDDQEEEEEEEDEDENEDEEKLTKEEEENAKRKENLVLMQYGADFYKISSDIAKETWVVGGIKDSLSRSRSSKR